MTTFTETQRIGIPLEVEGTHNFRSTGGYATSGSVTRYDGLFRSDGLNLLTDLGIEQFRSLGIVRVIDLRDLEELKQAPSVTRQVVETVHLSIFEGASALSSNQAVPSLKEVYRIIAADRVARLVGAVRLIADAPEGGVLVHCTAGKDRTGMVVGTALLAVGVSREDVLADYAASAENLAGEWVDRMIASAAKRFPGPIDDTVRELITESPAEALAAALDEIDERYGSAEQMLRAGGFDDQTLGRLRSRLVA